MDHVSIGAEEIGVSLFSFFSETPTYSREEEIQ
jgi:hypothetical protein